MRLKLETGNEVEALVRVVSGKGTRPKCLLLHGNPGSITDWQQLVPELAETADLAALDFPGFGQSSRVSHEPESLSLDRLAELALSAANALDWREPFFIVGHSHGAGVAQVAAARYPERIAGLALIASMGAPAHAKYRLLSLPGAAPVLRLAGRMFRVALFERLSRVILRQAMADIFSPEPVSAEDLERELALFRARPGILESMVHVTLGRPSARLLQAAPEIRCPTLFLHGTEDALVPVSYARAIHERISSAGGRSRFHEVPFAGHMLMKYQARELARLIAESFSAGTLAAAANF